jgi:hypothetical protein
LKGLDFPSDLRCKSRDETTKKEWVGEANYTVSNSFEFIKVVVDRTGLCEFEEGAAGVVVVQRSKTCFEGEEEILPGID